MATFNVQSNSDWFSPSLPSIDVTNGYVALCDVDADGARDLLSGTAHGLLYWHNEGTDAAPQLVAALLSDSVATFDDVTVAGLACGDMNGDGRADLVFGWDLTADPAVYYANQGDGTFEATELPLTALPSSKAAFPTLGDVNGDGILDLGLGETNGAEFAMLSWYYMLGTNDTTPEFTGNWEEVAYADNEVLYVGPMLTEAGAYLPFHAYGLWGVQTLNYTEADGFQTAPFNPWGDQNVYGYNLVDASGFGGIESAVLDGRFDEFPLSTVASGATDVSVVGTPEGGVVDVTWTAPEDDGGSSITAFVVVCGLNSHDAAGTDTSAEFTFVLANGNHTCCVSPVNAVGVSPNTACTDSFPMTTATVPPAPVVECDAGDTTLTASWSATGNGGASVTAYTVTDSVGYAYTGLNEEHSYSDLAPGTALTVTVVATNSEGDSAEGSCSVTITPSTPLAPANLTLATASFPNGATNPYVSSDSDDYHPVPQQPTFGDIDSDGDDDLVVFSLRFPMEVYENRDGSFYPMASTPLDEWATAVAGAFGDVDQDGFTDAVLVLNYDDVTPVLLRNQGNGSFAADAAATQFVSTEIFDNLIYATMAMDLADTTGDGVPELFVAWNYAVWQYSFSGGVFSPEPAQDVLSDLTSDMMSMCLADVDADDDVDVVLAMPTTGAESSGWPTCMGEGLTLLLNNGTGGFETGPVNAYTCGLVGCSTGAGVLLNNVNIVDTMTQTSQNNPNWALQWLTLAGTIPDPVPSAPSVESTGPTSAVVSWDAAPDNGVTVTAYVVIANNATSGKALQSYFDANSVTGNPAPTSLRAINLPTDVEVAFSVIAVNGAGLSVPSDLSEGVSLSTGVPDAPIVYGSGSVFEGYVYHSNDVNMGGSDDTVGDDEAQGSTSWTWTAVEDCYNGSTPSLPLATAPRGGTATQLGVSPWSDDADLYTLYSVVGTTTTEFGSSSTDPVAMWTTAPLEGASDAIDVPSDTTLSIDYFPSVGDVNADGALDMLAWPSESDKGLVMFQNGGTTVVPDFTETTAPQSLSSLAERGDTIVWADVDGSGTAADDAILYTAGDAAVRVALNDGTGAFTLSTSDPMSQIQLPASTLRVACYSGGGSDNLVLFAIDGDCVISQFNLDADAGEYALVRGWAAFFDDELQRHAPTLVTAYCPSSTLNVGFFDGTGDGVEDGMLTSNSAQWVTMLIATGTASEPDYTFSGYGSIEIDDYNGVPSALYGGGFIAVGQSGVGLTATVAGVPPSKPLDVATSASDGKVHLSWTPPVVQGNLPFSYRATLNDWTDTETVAAPATKLSLPYSQSNSGKSVVVKLQTVNTADAIQFSTVEITIDSLPDYSDGLSDGAIAGIVLGCVAVVAVAGFLHRRRQNRRGRPTLGTLEEAQEPLIQG